MPSTGRKGIVRQNTRCMSDNLRPLPSYPSANHLAFPLFLFYVVYWYLQGGYRFPVLGQMRFEFLLAAILSAIALPTYLGKARKARTSLYAWAAVLIGLMAVMTIFSVAPSVSLETFVDRVLKFSLQALFIAAFVRSPAQLKWYMAAFLVAFLKMGQEGFFGTLGGSMTWMNQGIPRLHGATPVYFHPNAFAGSQLASIPFLFFFFPLAPRWLRVVMIVQATFAAFVIVFSGSRAGYVGAVGGLGALLVLSQNKKKALVWALIIGATALPFIPDSYVRRAGTIFTQEEIAGHSMDARTRIIADAWAVFLTQPFGIGVKAFPTVREWRFGRTQDTHNLYLEVATNLGIQGLFVFGGFIVALWRTLACLGKNLDAQIDSMRQGHSQGLGHEGTADPIAQHLNDLRMMRATVAAAMGFLIIRGILGLFGHNFYEIYWWFLLGLTIAILNMNLVAAERTERLVGMARDFSGGRPAGSR
jgi:putative inorganic carbon (HCO3(-)) transporter